MSKKDILIIGGGGREHAIGWKLKQSPRCGVLYFLPGNAGTAALGLNIPSPLADWRVLPGLVRGLRIDLVIVGPELPLSEGVVDILRAEGIAVVGPTKEAARLETSKAFAKTCICEDAGIPTAPFKTFDDLELAIAHAHARSYPCYVKASGLREGKGARLCLNPQGAEAALREFMERPGDEVVIEDMLEGEEISIHAFCDSSGTRFAPPTQDHKRLLDDGQTRFDGTNPNTGGMGAIGPVPWVSVEQMTDIDRHIVEPVEQEMRRCGIPYTGILYPGLMMTPSGPHVLEFNVRFGDPEAQVLMRLLKSDAVDLFEALATNRIADGPVLWHDDLFAVSIVLAARGYPEHPETGFPVHGVADAETIPGVNVFHAGTRMHEGVLLTDGGRVLNVTATGRTLEQALATAYRAIGVIHFDGMHYRGDIGTKARKRTSQKEPV